MNIQAIILTILTLCSFTLTYSQSFDGYEPKSRILAPASPKDTVINSAIQEITPTISLKTSVQYLPNKATQLIKNPSALQQLDQFVQSSITRGAMPGCQIMAIKDGVVILDKSYGTLNGNSQFPVTNNTLYDIASVTKIAATTLAIMKLFDEGKIMLHGTLMAYIPETIGTDKANLRISDLLTHQAGLKSWIPFYKYTLDSLKAPLSRFYNKDTAMIYTIPIAKNLFGNKHLTDSIWSIILKSPLENKGKYVYSDLDLLFLERIVQNVTGMPLDMYVKKHFYKPMELSNITYNPWQYNLSNRCAPTENDQYFRYQTIKGYVHDQGASMLGGVAGHAGLFATAHNVGAIMQMLLDGGMYNGKQYIKSSTVELFTGYRSSISRRGYGFDKPEKKTGDGGPAADICSKKTFGHQGFTGTCAWADPQTGIVFVMLANRVYPSAENKTFANLNVRTEAQKLIYNALGYK